MNNLTIEQRIQNKLQYLNTMADKYEELNKKTNNKYLWRLQGIQLDIQTLENILNDITGEWDEAFDEDLKESKEL